MWYRTLKAAQYLRVAPWELTGSGQGLYWLQAAEMASTLEAEAERVAEQKRTNGPGKFPRST